MFTGIIEEIGTIRGIKRGNRSVVLEVQAKKVLEDLHVGDSIATNGVCLTVTSFANGSFCADVMPETMSRSNLGELHVGDRVKFGDMKQLVFYKRTISLLMKTVNMY